MERHFGMVPDHKLSVFVDGLSVYLDRLLEAGHVHWIV